MPRGDSNDFEEVLAFRLRQNAISTYKMTIQKILEGM